MKNQALRLGTYKNRIDKPGNMMWPQFYVKMVDVNFDNFVLDTNNYDKINDNMTMKIHL